MKKRRVTELNAVLADWDEGFLPDGRQKFFSVGFVTQNGEFRFIKRGVRSGLKINMKKHDYKAVQPVDADGEPIDHIYPVWIHAILYYSGNVIMNLLKNGES